MSESEMKEKNVSQEKEHQAGLPSCIQQYFENNTRLSALNNYFKLPSQVRRRVQALKKLQLAIIETEAKYFNRVNRLENCRGIPDYWLTIFRNVPLLAQNKSPADDPILSSLKNIKCQIYSNSPHRRPGFTLEFIFGSNDYFTNKVLFKRYYIRLTPSPRDPLSYEGPEIVQARGCTIHWKPQKNGIIKSNAKLEKDTSNAGAAKHKSFFNFFNPPTINIDNVDTDTISESTEDALEKDFVLGQFFREKVIPRATLFYLGYYRESEDGPCNKIVSVRNPV